MKHKLLRASLAGACALLLSACGDGPQPTPAKTAADSAGPVAPAQVAAAPDSLPAFVTGTAGMAPAPAVPAMPAGPAAAPADSAPRKRIVAPPAPPPNVEVPGPVNAMAVSDYELTMERLRKMRQAGLNLSELQRAHPELRQAMAMQQPDPNRVYERLNSIPEARAAVEAAGLSPRDYSMGMAALLQAMMVHQMRKNGMNPPVQANERNVEFIAANEQEIMQLLTSAAAQAQQQQGQRP